MLRAGRSLFVCLFCLLPATPVAAQQKAVAVDVGLGLASGLAREHVYDSSGAAMSRLDWRIEDVWVATVDVAWSPVKRFTFLAKGRIGLTDDAAMVNQDWIAACPGGYCRSDHSETRVTTLASVDVSGIYQFYGTPNLSLGATAGYRFDQTRWEASGGTANYATLPAGVGITYQQQWEAPYAGLVAAMRIGKWSAEGRVVGSLWGTGHDEDTHHLRGLRFEQSYDAVRMAAASARLAYDLTSAMAIAVNYEVLEWRLAKSATVLTSLATGEQIVTAPDTAGAENRTQSLSLSLSYRF